MTDRMGYEARIFYGTPGATATSPMPNVRDFSENTSTTFGNTTTRGTSSAPPIATSGAAMLEWEATWTMINKTGDAGLVAIRAAFKAGSPLAIRTVDFDGGIGFDGDCVFSISKEFPLDGEQAVEVTARAYRGLREPQIDI